MMGNTPKFNRPPVIETAIGVSFKPLPSWYTPQFGLYWAQIRKDYSRSEIQPPLPLEKEMFGESAREFTLMLGRQVERCWYIDDDNGWLLQIQNSRFLSNWRRQPNGVYPSYQRFSKKFFSEWERFNTFLDSEEIERPNPEQVEVSYVNHIDVDSDMAKLRCVFPDLAGLDRDRAFLSNMEAVSFNAVHVIGDNRGRLYFRLDPVVRHADAKTVMQLSITANVLVASNEDEALTEAIDLGHTWVVCGFADFTSDKKHQEWERTC